MTEIPILRAMRPGDVPALVQLSAQSRARYRAIPGLAHIADSPPVAAERFHAATGFTALLGDLPVGFALIRPLDGALYLDNISTRADLGGRGIGAALLARVIAQAATDARPAVTLTTFRGPRWNGPWFRRFGFAPMPPGQIGPGLAAVIARQSAHLDPATREVLWRPVASP